MCKKHVVKVLGFVLCLVMVLSMIPCVPVYADAPAYSGEGYRDLQKEEHRIAYALIEEGVAGLSPIITFEDIVNINYKEMCKVIRAVAVDNPQYFWFLEAGKFTYDTHSGKNYIISFEPEYLLDGKRVSIGSQELIDALNVFHNKVQEIVAGIPVNYTSDYQIALYLHDYLADHITYTLEGDHPSAYAALIHGQAACYGYSKAYQCLLNAAGVRARTITGDTPDENGKLVGHAWNQVWLNGDCYYVDVTWDDFEVLTMHEYFAMSLEEISQDHFAEPEFILPQCDHDLIGYHATTEGRGVANISTFTTASDAAACFRLQSLEGKKAVFVCEIRFSGGDFFDWLNKRYDDLRACLGLSYRTEAYYYQQNNVYYLEMIDLAYTTQLPVVSQITLKQDSVVLPNPGAQFQLDPKVTADYKWWPDLVYTSSDPSVITVGDNGLVTAVGEGSAVVTVSSLDGSVSAQCIFQVDPAPVHVHTMRAFSKISATCTQDGHEAYYLCSGCGRRFADEAGTTEYSKVESFVLPATGHTELSWVNRLDHHQQQCQCGDVIEDTKENHSDLNGDEACDVCGSKMSLEEWEQGDSGQKDSIAKKKDFTLGYIIGAVLVLGVGVVAFVVIRKRIRGY